MKEKTSGEETDAKKIAYFDVNALDAEGNSALHIAATKVFFPFFPPLSGNRTIPFFSLILGKRCLRQAVIGVRIHELKGVEP